MMYVEFGNMAAVDLFADGSFTGNLDSPTFVGVQSVGFGAGGTTTGGAPTATITCFSPASGAAGSTVTITGTNLGLGFSPAPIVAFGATDVSTPLGFNGQTSITVTVPAGLAAGNYSITIRGMTGTPMTVGTYTVAAGAGGATTGGGTGVTFSASFGGATTVSDTLAGGQLQVTNSAVVTHSGTWTTTGGASVVVNHYTSPTAEYVTTMAQNGMNLSYLNLPSPRNCYIFGGAAGAPTCSSVGIAFNRAAGTVTFTNTPMDTGMSMSGTLHFPTF